MDDSQRYRHNAAECLLAAQEACEPSCRKLLVTMAVSWLSLAHQDEDKWPAVIAVRDVGTARLRRAARWPGHRAGVPPDHPWMGSSPERWSYWRFSRTDSALAWMRPRLSSPRRGGRG